MKLVINIDNIHIITLQIKDPSLVTLGHIVQIVNHNLAPQFRPRCYQRQNYFTLEQLPHTLVDLRLTLDGMALGAERELKQGQDDLSIEFSFTMLDPSILTIESIMLLSPETSKQIIEELGEGKVTDSIFTGLTHLTLPDCDNRLEFLIKLIKHTPTFKNLEIRTANFSTENAIQLAEELKDHLIEYLGLPCGNIGIRGAASLIKNLKALKVLNLHNQSYHQPWEGEAELVDVLERNTSLEQVIFTRTDYITYNLPMIRKMMQTNKTIESFEVTTGDYPDKKEIAGEIMALGKHNAGYKALRTIFDCIPFMNKLLIPDLVFLICDYLVDTLKYNGINLSVLEIYKKPIIVDNLAHRFFPSVNSVQGKLDKVLQISLPGLVQEYKSKGKIEEAILNTRYFFEPKAIKSRVETIIKLDNLGIENVEDCIAAKLRIAERFRLLFTPNKFTFSVSGVNEVIVGIEVISGYLILNSIDRIKFLSIMSDTDKISPIFQPQLFRVLFVSEESNPQNWIKPDSSSSLLATQSLVVSSSSSSSSSTSLSTAYSSTKGFPN